MAIEKYLEEREKEFYYNILWKVIFKNVTPEVQQFVKSFHHKTAKHLIEMFREIVNSQEIHPTGWLEKNYWINETCEKIINQLPVIK